MKVLIACEYSGRTREAFRTLGHDAISCDLLPSEDNSPNHIIGDALAVANESGWDLMIAHPPCTYLANSGARWLWQHGYAGERPDASRWRDMLEGAKFFADLLLAPIPKIAVENPVMHGHGKREITRLLVDAGLLGMPRTQFVQPWWYGDPAFKATGFTLKGLPPLKRVPALQLVPPKKALEPDRHKAWSAIHMASPGPNRWKDRSRTFPGIANQIAEQWS